MDYKIARVLRNLNIITQKDLNSTCNLKFKKKKLRLWHIFIQFFSMSPKQNHRIVSTLTNFNKFLTG